MSVASMRPAFHLKMALQEGIQTTSGSEGTNQMIRIDYGEAISLDSDFPFYLEVYDGYDNIFIREDGSAAYLDCRVFCRTKSGTPAIIDYTGVLRPEGIVADLLANKASTMEYKDGYITNNVRVKLDHKAESDLAWVNRYNLVGKGKFFRDDKDKLHIEYIVHVIE
ncbi:hypothetical protein TRICI_006800 [Trichomonascus ciferrii]|uniref:DUF3237 domain-containing protein n=1 Tax=Trichomonascus ciferrii TaxID=44093 RepID=A0A642UDA6_9ASCO|nr:hypothetical protein TRICI_006800 [Trichomonascus ciferrii]